MRLKDLHIRHLLVAPFVLLLCAAVGLVWWLSWETSLEVEADLGRQLRGEISARVKARLTEYLAVPPLVNRLNANALETGRLDLGDPSVWQPYFYRHIATFPSIAYSFFGTVDGEFYGARRLADGQLQLVRAGVSTGGDSHNFAITEQGLAGPLKQVYPRYDPRKRPWYQAAADLGRPTWSPIYRHFTIPDLAITASWPIHQASGRLRGVFGVDFVLTHINRFLRGIKVGRSGAIYIIERDGNLVSSSTLEAPFTLDDGRMVRRQAAGLEDALIGPVTRQLTQHLGSLSLLRQATELDVSLGDKRLYVEITPLEDNQGLDWLIVTVVPEEDFTQRIQANQNRTMLLGLGALFLALGAGLAVARRILEPLKQLGRAAHALGEGNWKLGREVDMDRRDELGQLARAYQGMADHLEENMHLLEKRNRQVSEANQLLENKVAERTAELERANRELKISSLEAQAASRAKSQFLANMSHEIRTPMNAIIGMTNLVLETRVSPQQEDYLGIVRSSSLHLLSLLNDILDLSKIEAGKMELVPAPFALRSSLEEIIATQVRQAREKGLDLIYLVRPEVPDDLVGDLGRLRQVLLNLVSNAIKFTQEGEISVQVGVEELTPSQVVLKVAVADTGIGIPPDKTREIFEPFAQADASTSRRYGGTGLGLTISSQLVEMMGGRLTLESEPGQGSTFTFQARLDLAAPDQVAAPPPEAPAGSAPAPGPSPALRILLAEDNLVNQKLAKILLERQGHQVVVAQDGVQALETARAQPFDLVLMDVEMPEMDGLAATRAIREWERRAGGHLPIIAMTAHAMSEDRQRCLEAGMDDYLPKPLEAGKLYQKVDAWGTKGGQPWGGPRRTGE